jgi:hypothetical protein
VTTVELLKVADMGQPCLLVKSLHILGAVLFLGNIVVTGC